MYVVVSFDFGGTNEQKIYCMNNDYTTSHNIYDNLVKTLDLHDSDKGCGCIVEMLEIPDNYVNDKGYRFYWADKTDDASIRIVETTADR